MRRPEVAYRGLRGVVIVPSAFADAEVHAVLCRHRANVDGHDGQVVRYRCAQNQEGYTSLCLASDCRPCDTFASTRNRGGLPPLCATNRASISTCPHR